MYIVLGATSAKRDIREVVCWKSNGFVEVATKKLLSHEI
jgi:hypothetical protein